MSKIKLSIFKEDATDKFLENLQSIYSLGSQIDIEERKIQIRQRKVKE